MARRMEKSDKAHRAVIVRTDNVTEETQTDYYGPYAAFHVAKAQATRLVRDRARHDTTATYAGHVERSTVLWFYVDELGVAV